MPKQHRAASVPSSSPESRAQAPRAPETSPAVRAAKEENEQYQQDRQGLERRSMQRGLMLLAILAVAVSAVRAGADRAFFTGWWRQW